MGMPACLHTRMRVVHVLVCVGVRAFVRAFVRACTCAYIGHIYVGGDECVRG